MCRQALRMRTKLPASSSLTRQPPVYRTNRGPRPRQSAVPVGLQRRRIRSPTPQPPSFRTSPSLEQACIRHRQASHRRRAVLRCCWLEPMSMHSVQLSLRPRLSIRRRFPSVYFPSNPPSALYTSECRRLQALSSAPEDPEVTLVGLQSRCGPLPMSRRFPRSRSRISRHVDSCWSE